MGEQGTHRCAVDWRDQSEWVFGDCTDAETEVVTKRLAHGHLLAPFTLTLRRPGYVCSLGGTTCLRPGNFPATRP